MYKRDGIVPPYLFISAGSCPPGESHESNIAQYLRPAYVLISPVNKVLLLVVCWLRKSHLILKVSPGQYMFKECLCDGLQARQSLLNHVPADCRTGLPHASQMALQSDSDGFYYKPSGERQKCFRATSLRAIQRTLWREEQSSSRER
jgi:hypothetical protein